jgi:hypothetical protein
MRTVVDMPSYYPHTNSLQVTNGSKVSMSEAKPVGKHGQKEHKGRWGAIDAGVDMSDDQVRTHPLQQFSVLLAPMPPYSPSSLPMHITSCSKTSSAAR